MAAEIVNINLIQEAPFDDPGGEAKVAVSFDILGVLPDVVEVYAGTAGAPMGVLAETVEIQPPHAHGEVVLDLRAGILYTITLCPRTATGDVLDEMMEGRYWESFCSSVTFATKVRAGEFPPPVFTFLTPRHRTLTRTNRIDVAWESSRAYSFFNLIFSREGLSPAQIEVAGSTSGRFTLEATTPGARYGFQVQGVLRHFSGSGNSPFTFPPLVVRAADKTRSVREFLEGSDIRVGMRQLAPALPLSVRALMEV